MKAGWEVKPLGEVCNLVGGGTPSKKAKAYYGGSIPWVTVRDMNVETIEITDHTITEIGLKNSSSKIIPKGEIIIASRVGLGKVCKLADDMAINQDLKGVIPKRGSEIDRQFLFYWFQSVASFIEENGVGATVQGVKLSFLNALPFPVVPLEEQKRIVAVLDAAFEGLTRAKENAEANLQNARELFVRVLGSQFQELTGETEGLLSLQELSISYHQGLNTAGQKVKFFDEGYPIIQTRNITNGTIDIDNKIKFLCEDDWETYREKFKPNAGDVFFTNIGTIGKTAVLEEDAKYLIHWNIFKITPKKSLLNSHFLKYRLDDLTNSGFFQQMQKGGTVDFVTKKMMSEVLIPSVSLSVQKTLVSKIQSAESNLAIASRYYQEKTADISDLRQSLLQKAFAGELT